MPTGCVYSLEQPKTCVNTRIMAVLNFLMTEIFGVVTSKQILLIY